jgi:hypothetical protein
MTVNVLLDFIVHPHFVILAGHDGDFADFALAVDHEASSAMHATKMADLDRRFELIVIVI